MAQFKLCEIASDGKSVAPSKFGSTENSVKMSSSNIKVMVRVRPLNRKEMELNNRIVIDVVDDTMLVFDPKEEASPFFYQGVQQPNKNFLKRPNKELKFVFDQVCGPGATNQDVFEITTKDMLMSLMEGYNCSVFVYGATGAGKTFTMIGSQDHPGITYLTMEHLFYTMDSFKKERDFDIGVSYLEIYNENVFDLLKTVKTPLQLREDSKYGVMVAGLTRNKINTAKELINMLENGNKNRTQHPTDANAESSRSHAVFQVYVKMRYKTTSQVRIVKLSMIDLAGSERACATGCVGPRFKEGANINRSLLSLGNCINKLADGSKYITYRDSKLTRLLKDSLGGNCKTIMIANISPSSVSYDDTYNTLKYAARANKIQQHVKKNIVDGDMKLSEYVKIIEELKKNNRELEAKLTLSNVQVVSAEPDPAKEKAQQEWRRRITAEEARHAALEQQLLALLCRQRVLALRHGLRLRAFGQVADLAHRSSCEAMEQMCTEDIPRQERAAESYMKQAISLDSKIHSAWGEWDQSRRGLQALADQALAACPDLRDFVRVVQLQSELRQIYARDDLRHKLLVIQNEEINSLNDYIVDMPALLKKLYLTLKGYNKVPPALAEEYHAVMRKAKSAKGISWSDRERVGGAQDHHFGFISSLDLSKPTTTPSFSAFVRREGATPAAACDGDGRGGRGGRPMDSDESADVENVAPAKRKGTPIKLANNQTIIIDDSLEMLDATRTLDSAKKVKKDFGCEDNVENDYGGALDAKDLNSTFVLAGKVEALRKFPVKMETSAPPARGLVDRTNTMTRSLNFNDRAKIVKPVVGRAIAFRRAAPQAPPPVARGGGFGSTLSRDGTPLQRTRQVRARERMLTHPYSRPVPAQRR